MTRQRFAHLPEPSFIERDGAKVLAEIIADFEARTGKPLVPSQVERLLIDTMAYRETLARIAFQQACLQCLVAFARFPMIDHLAAYGGVGRLAARPARTVLRFTIPAALGIPSPVPQGSRGRTRDGKVIFATDADDVIATGDTFIEVWATATTPGPIGNDYAAGQVDDLIDDLGFACSVANVVSTSGGSPSETSDQLAERLPDAVQAISGAGPDDAYRFHAMSAHPDIVDVAVSNPAGGVVLLTVLTKTGAASGPILTLVLAAASAKKVRPITDTVQAESATPANFALTVELTLYAGVETADVLAAAELEAQKLVDSLRVKLGRSPVTSQVTKAVSVEGVYSAVVTSPAGPMVVGPREWANCTAVTVTVVGYWSPS